jgi:hypothetical protein
MIAKELDRLDTTRQKPHTTYMPEPNNKVINAAIKASDVDALESYKAEFVAKLLILDEDTPVKGRTFTQRLEAKNVKYQIQRIDQAIKILNHKLLQKTRAERINSIDPIALGAYIGSIKQHIAQMPRQSEAKILAELRQKQVEDFLATFSDPLISKERVRDMCTALQTSNAQLAVQEIRNQMIKDAAAYKAKIEPMDDWSDVLVSTDMDKGGE